MKIKPIERMQSGGAIPPFSYYDVLPRATASDVVQEADPQATTTTGESLFDDYTTKQLVEYGLPSDVNNFLSTAQSVYNQNPFRRDNVRQGAQQQYQILSKLNSIRFNKEQYDSAMKEAINKEALGEPALTDTGRMIALDIDGNLTHVTIDEYDPEEFQLVTVGQLGEIRANNPSLAFDKSTLSIIQNSIGRQSIVNKITDSVSKLRTDSITNERYLSPTAKEDLNILTQLASGGPNGVYKYSTAEQGLSNDKIKRAVSNIYRQFNSKEKSLLSAMALQNGLDPNQGPLQFIYDTIVTNTGTTTSNKIDFDSQATKEANEKTESSTGLGKYTQGMAVLNGQGAIDKPYNLRLGTQATYTVPNAKWYSSLLNSKDEPILGSSALGAIQSSWISTVGDLNSVHFGKEKVSIDQLAKMAFNGMGGITQVFLPYNESNGSINIDYNSLEQLDKARAEVLDTDATLPQEIMEIYNKYGVKQFYNVDPASGVESGLLRPFILFNALATNDFVSEDSGADKIPSRIFGSDEWNKAYAQYMQALTGGDKKAFDDITGIRDRINADILKGVVSIPYSGDAITTAAREGVLQAYKVDNEVKYLEEAAWRRKNSWSSPTITNFSSQR